MKLKILHLEASPGWGGQEIRILREAEGMRKRGHEVILGVMKGGKLIEKAEAAGFLVYPLNFKRSGWISCLFELRKILKKHRIDLVNTHSSLDAWIGGIAARLLSKILVRTRHLSTPIKGGMNARILYGKLADFVVTTCESIIPQICEKSRKKRALCKSIPTGIDPEAIRFNEQEKEKYRSLFGAGPHDFVIGTACFMRSWKGIADFLEAAKRLRDVPNLKWTIIGGGHAETYKKLALEKGLEKIVHFTGHLENPFPALAALDCFALLSTAHEGVSQAILQAAFLGKPLIATPVGGLGEVCIPGKTGFQVAPFSPDQVASAVLELKQNDALRNKLGSEAKAWVDEKFIFSRTLKEMEDVYRSLYT